MAMEVLNIKTTMFISVTSIKAKSKGKANTDTPMVIYIRENGSMI